MDPTDETPDTKQLPTTSPEELNEAVDCLNGTINNLKSPPEPAHHHQQQHHYQKHVLKEVQNIPPKQHPEIQTPPCTTTTVNKFFFPAYIC